MRLISQHAINPTVTGGVPPLQIRWSMADDDFDSGSFPPPGLCDGTVILSKTTTVLSSASSFSFLARSFFFFFRQSLSFYPRCADFSSTSVHHLAKKEIIRKFFHLISMEEVEFHELMILGHDQVPHVVKCILCYFMIFCKDS